MKRLFYPLLALACVASMSASTAYAQNVGTYVETSTGNTKNAIGTVDLGSSVPSGGTDSGNPIKVAGKYNATLPNFTDGQRGDLQINSNGELRVLTVGQNATGTDAAGNSSLTSLSGTGTQNASGRPLLTVGLVYNGTSWDRIRDVTAAGATTGIGLQGAGVLGRFDTTPVTVTTGQYSIMQMTARGSPVVAFGSGGTQGDGASSPAIYPLNQAGTAGPLGVMSFLMNGSTSADRPRSILGADGTGLGVAAVAAVPHSSATGALAPTVTSAVASSLVLKAGAGNLYDASVTTGASAGYLMVFNATSAPVDGAVTPQMVYAVAANTSFIWTATSAEVPERFTTGITIVFSTTGPFSKTASATAFLRGRAQ